ncbi:unnamed protein product [Meganyctiphanes norvegica]|uniref:Cytochrome P450 n=1 Tax=Meganyctiphanes norvegica TaxID=48144 RepID=A0AAV2Q325_MEGNR
MEFKDINISSNTLLTVSLLPSICLALLLVVLVRWHLGRRHRMALLSLIPGPKRRLFFGNALELMVPPLEQFKHITKRNLWWRQHTPLILVWLFHLPFVQLFTPETVETVLSSNSLIDKGTQYNILHPWLGTGLLTSSGSKWHTRRKMLTPTFHFKILGDFLHVMNKQAQKFVEHLKPNSEGSAFNIYPYVTLCTLDIICESTMGCSIHAQDNKESEYTKAVSRVVSLIRQRSVKPWLFAPAIYRMTKEGKEFDKCLEILHSFTRKTIQQRRKENSTRNMKDEIEADQDGIGQKRRLAFLDLLLESSNNGQYLSDEDIREEVDTFMFEGHDTTAAGVSWAIYLIGRDPKVQARIQEELTEVFGEDKDRPTTMDDLRKLRYLECCIKEALRLYPSVPLFSRYLREDLACDKFIIPAKSEVIVVPYMVHRDPNHWPDPEVYDPDRFSSENSSGRHPYAYIPFSAGPRNCIGQKFALMEEKVILSTLFRNFKIECVVQRENLNIIGDMILKSNDGVLLKLQNN